MLSSKCSSGENFNSLNESFQLFAKAKSYFQIHATYIKEYKKKKAEADTLELFLSEENKSILIALIADRAKQLELNNK